MERVWHRRRWLRPILGLLARWAVLYPEQGSNVPTRMLIAPARDRRGRPVHIWRRTFAFPAERRIDAELAYEPELGQLVDGWARGTRWRWHGAHDSSRLGRSRSGRSSERYGCGTAPRSAARALRVSARALDAADRGRRRPL